MSDSATEQPPPMKPREFALLTPDTMGDVQYRSACRRLGLAPRPAGYGLLHCVDVDGDRWTRVGDAEYTRALISLPAHARAHLEIPAEVYPLARSGWPDEW